MNVINVNKPTDNSNKSIPPHYNQWGRSGQCKPKNKKSSSNDNSINISEKIYYIDENGFDTTFLSPW